VPRPLSRTTLLVAAILALALALRLVEVEATTHYRPVNDAGSYLKLASEIAHTGDYSGSHAPGVGAGGSHGPSAYFPPGYPYFLAAVDLIDGHTAVTRIGTHTRIPGGAVHGARISQALLGTLTVALIGLVAAEGLGELAGLIALVLAAIYPVFIGLSGTLVAENLATPLILASVWFALRARRSPRPYGWSAGAGLLAGLSILAHANLIVLVVPLILITWRVAPARDPAAPEPAPWRRLAAPGVMLACLLLALTPWLVRNAVVMHRFVFVTDETGITLVGTYNAASAANRPVPYKWRLFTGIPSEAPLARQARHLTEPGLSDRLRSHALSYIGDHPLSPAAVVFHNSLRLLELEGSSAWRASADAIALPQGMARAGVIGFWIVCLLALAGAVTRAGRAAWRWLWLAPVLLWLSVAVINAETPRFREPVDAFLIVLAACALASVVRRASGRLRGAPVAGSGVDPLPGGASQRVEVGQRLT
jgi:4-amino-4-deoxy-L-arabinose transferase-like glycosyltransferase